MARDRPLAEITASTRKEAGYAQHHHGPRSDTSRRSASSAATRDPAARTHGAGTGGSADVLRRRGTGAAAGGCLGRPRRGGGCTAAGSVDRCLADGRSGLAAGIGSRSNAGRAERQHIRCGRLFDSSLDAPGRRQCRSQAVARVQRAQRQRRAWAGLVARWPVRDRSLSAHDGAGRSAGPARQRQLGPAVSGRTAAEAGQRQLWNRRRRLRD